MYYIGCVCIYIYIYLHLLISKSLLTLVTAYEWYGQDQKGWAALSHLSWGDNDGFNTERNLITYTMHTNALQNTQRHSASFSFKRERNSPSAVIKGQIHYQIEVSAWLSFGARFSESSAVPGGPQNAQRESVINWSQKEGFRVRLNGDSVAWREIVQVG